MALPALHLHHLFRDNDGAHLQVVCSLDVTREQFQSDRLSAGSARLDMLKPLRMRTVRDTMRAGANSATMCSEIPSGG